MQVSWQPPHPLCRGKLNPAWRGGQVLCQPHKQDCTSSQLQRGNCLNRLLWSEQYVHARGSWLTPKFPCRLNKGVKDNRRTLVALSGFWGEAWDVTWGLEKVLSWVICWQPFQGSHGSSSRNDFPQATTTSRKTFWRQSWSTWVILCSIGKTNPTHDFLV